MLPRIAVPVGGAASLILWLTALIYLRPWNTQLPIPKREPANVVIWKVGCVLVWFLYLYRVPLVYLITVLIVLWPLVGQVRISMAPNSSGAIVVLGGLLLFATFVLFFGQRDAERPNKQNPDE